MDDVLFLHFLITFTVASVISVIKTIDAVTPPTTFIMKMIWDEKDVVTNELSQEH